MNIDDMTPGELAVWSAAYVAAFNAHCPPAAGVSAERWAKYADEVQKAVVLAAKRATLTLRALRDIPMTRLQEGCDHATLAAINAIVLP